MIVVVALLVWAVAIINMGVVVVEVLVIDVWANVVSAMLAGKDTIVVVGVFSIIFWGLPCQYHALYMCCLTC